MKKLSRREVLAGCMACAIVSWGLKCALDELDEKVEKEKTWHDRRRPKS